MSVWTHIEGQVRILKKDKVSIKDVLEKVFTDEFVLNVKTEDHKHFWHHEINCRLCIDGQAFMERYDDLLYELKPIRGGLDLTATIRLLS
jgi:hypothetical protein